MKWQSFSLNRGIVFLSLVVLGLVLVSNHHLGYSFGDSIFRALGLPPWSEQGNHGLHISAITGIFLLIAGYLGATIYYLPRYRKIRSRIIIGCIAFVWLSPIVSEYAMFILKYNSTGIRSVAYSLKDSQCSFQTYENNRVHANCSLTLYNYGNQPTITLRPVTDNHPEIVFQPETFFVSPHSRVTINKEFIAVPDKELNFSGWSRVTKYEIEASGETKIVE
ncbi:hypothetical protein [Paenibacillus sp. GCM10027626]|uniref:hypothetical protein n=1 Tax=Paenibacillus sp. GCM10027626 TaxID=3273411 RepID=UPI003638A960